MTTSKRRSRPGRTGFTCPAATTRRRRAGCFPAGLIGVSAHTPQEAAGQLAAGADYATLSPIFLTQSKPGYGPAVGLDALATASLLAPARSSRSAASTGNLGACLAVGARGVAVMGEIMRAADPEAATSRLLAAFAGRADAR